MKLIDRSKYITDTEGGYITNCISNEYKSTVFEQMWLAPEVIGLPNGNHPKTNFGWFLLFLWCPWFTQIVCSKNDDIMSWSVGEFLALCLAIILTLCFIGPIFNIYMSYRNVKEAKTWLENHKNYDRYKDAYEKYHELKWF